MSSHSRDMLGSVSSGGSQTVVDRLSEAFIGLGLEGSVRAQNAKQKQEYAIRPRDQLSHGGNQESDGALEVTPSRLSCLKELRDELTCAVCLDICVRPCTTPCGHNYCRSCLRRNLEVNRPKCPKCRANLAPGFALSINTALWNTIQHLFPGEANAKPLTPPPYQAQQHTAHGQAPARRAAGQGAVSAAAPFRPPRMGNVAMASLSARSAYVPGAQQQPYGPGQGGATGQAALSRSVVSSLAELGVRPAREGAAARRDRRRSRSAERWEGSARALLAASTGSEGHLTGVPVAAAASTPSTQVGSSSVLMDLLSGRLRSVTRAGGTSELQAPRAPAQAVGPVTIGGGGNTAPGSGAGPRDMPQVASSNRWLNPFLRQPRLAIVTPSVAGANVQTAAAAVPQGGAVTVLGRSAGPSQVIGVHQGLEAASAAGSTASNFTASQRVMLLGTRTRPHVPLAGDARSDAPLSRANGVCSAVGPTRGAENGPAAHPPRTTSTTSQGSGSCSSGGSFNTLASRDSSWSIRALDDGSSELELRAAGLAAPARGSDPWSPTATAEAASAVAGATSATWSELDEQVSRAMEPLEISPPSLPRLRLRPRQTAADSDAQAAAAVASSTREVAGGGRGNPDSATPQRGMDPDFAPNYDGEDPAGADTFFSSPFFDRALLAETLEGAAADPDGAGSEVGFSPRWAAGGDTDWLRSDEEEEQEAVPSTGEDSEDAVPSPRVTAVAGAAERGLVAVQQQPPALHARPVGPTGRGLLTGNRECPIELLSDSDDEDEELRPRGAGPGAPRRASNPAALGEPVRPSSQRVVSGLRRPHRA